MTTPAPTTSSAAAVSTIEATTLAALPGLIGIAFAGKAAGLNVSIQAGLTSADTDVARAIDQLVAELNAADASHPLVSAVIGDARKIAEVVGLDLPTQAEMVDGAKKSACDLLNSLKAPTTVQP